MNKHPLPSLQKKKLVEILWNILSAPILHFTAISVADAYSAAYPLYISLTTASLFSFTVVDLELMYFCFLRILLRQVYFLLKLYFLSFLVLNKGLPLISTAPERPVFKPAIWGLIQGNKVFSNKYTSLHCHASFYILFELTSYIHSQYVKLSLIFYSIHST